MKQKINEHDESLINKKLETVKEQLSNKDFLSHYILETLNNFAFRYFDNPEVATLVTSNDLRVVSLEKGIKEAIKIKNPELRAGIGELVKRVSREQGPTILSELRVCLEKGKGTSGNCIASARISFGHPHHAFNQGEYIEKISKFEYRDDIQLRNILAKHLETVSELFL